MQFDMATIQTLAITYGVRIFLAIVVFVIGKWLAGKITAILAKVLEKQNVELPWSSFYKIFFTICFSWQSWLLSPVSWGLIPLPS